MPPKKKGRPALGGGNAKRRPRTIIASAEVAALGPLGDVDDYGERETAATRFDPVRNEAFSRASRFSDARVAAERSTDPDARTARRLAAALTRWADEFEAEDAERALLPPAEHAADKAVTDNHRARVRAMERTLRGTTDRALKEREWAALLDLVAWIEDAAWVRMKAQEPEPASFWRAYVDTAVENLHDRFKREHPALARRVTKESIRGALQASWQPKKGAPKWIAVLPLGRALVGANDEGDFRRELLRRRSAQPA